MPEHSVRQGDCISSIAKQHGHCWEKVWNHPNNAGLRQRRESPNILYPGDVVFVPDREEKQESCITGQRHRFRKKGVQAKLRLRIMEESPPDEGEESTEPFAQESEVEPAPQEDRPRAGVSYVLDIDGELTNGTTDDDGVIEVNIPPDARNTRLLLEPGTPDEEIIPLTLGHLNPISELSGVKQRLANLGFDCGDHTEESTRALEAALTAFQEKYGLETTGDADQTTLDRLRQVHGN